jgi:uncharacterized membrane protein YhiD involved in acid resistance
MAVGVGGTLYVLAVAATLIMFITLSAFRRFEPAIGKRHMHQLYIEVSKENEQALDQLMESLREIGSVRSVCNRDATSEENRAFELRLETPPGARSEEVVDLLTHQDGLDRFKWSD